MRTHLDALEEIRSTYEGKLKSLEAQLAAEERRIEAYLKERRDLIEETRTLVKQANELLRLARHSEERMAMSPTLDLEVSPAEDTCAPHEPAPVVEGVIAEPVVALTDPVGLGTTTADVKKVLMDSAAKPSEKGRTVAQFILERADRPMLINEILTFFPDVGLAVQVGDNGKVTKQFRDIVRKAIESFDTYKVKDANYYWWPKERKPPEGSHWSTLKVLPSQNN